MTERGLRQSIANFEDDGMLRVDAMYPILLTESIPEDLAEVLLEMHADKRLKHYFGNEYKWLYPKKGKDEYFEYESNREMLRNLLEHISNSHRGFFVAKVSTPVRTFSSKTSYSYSWGYVRNGVLVAKDMVDLIEQGLMWVEKVESEDQKASKKKKKAKKK